MLLHWKQLLHRLLEVAMFLRQWRHLSHSSIYVVDEVVTASGIDEYEEIDMILIWFQWIVWFTGLYCNLLATPPSSKKHWWPSIKVYFMCWLRCWMAAHNWWHLSLSVSPSLGWRAALICKKHLQESRLWVQLGSTRLRSIVQSQDRYIFRSGLNCAFMPPSRIVTRLTLRIIPNGWYISSMVIFFHSNLCNLLPTTVYYGV